MDVLVHPLLRLIELRRQISTILIVIKYMLVQYFTVEMAIKKKDLVAVMSNLILGIEGQKLKLLVICFFS